MKIGLIVPANLKYSPYVNYYTDILQKQNIDYRIMSWDKAGIKEDVDMVYTLQTSDFDRKKILAGHFLFANKCKQYIKKENITHLIVYTIAPLYFMGYHFLKSFQGRIIMDIRDDSPFRRRFPDRLNRFADLAQTVVVSSPFYAEWIQKKSFQCHNVNLAMLDRYDDSFNHGAFTYPVKLTFAGMLIEEKLNMEVARQLADKEDFMLVFIGMEIEGKQKLRKYVEDNSIYNVTFKGEYKKDDIVDIYREEADIVNILRAKTEINKNALPNKLYDAVISGIPVAVYGHNEAISNYVKQYNLGIILKEEENLYKQLQDGIQHFDAQQYGTGRKEFLNKVRMDYSIFKDQLVQFCKE